MTFNIGTALAVLYGLTSLVPTAAHADYIYEYVGNTFNYGMNKGVTYTPATFNVVATLDSASALAANTTYTLSIGGSTFTSVTINSCSSLRCQERVSVTTNSSGAISSWSLFNGLNSPNTSINGSSTAATYDVPSDSPIGQPTFRSVPLYDAVFANGGLSGPDYVEGSTTPGTWSVVAPSVPLPASAYLLLSGLAGIGVAARRRTSFTSCARK